MQPRPRSRARHEMKKTAKEDGEREREQEAEGEMTNLFFVVQARNITYQHQADSGFSEKNFSVSQAWGYSMSQATGSIHKSCFLILPAAGTSPRLCQRCDPSYRDCARIGRKGRNLSSNTAGQGSSISLVSPPQCTAGNLNRLGTPLATMVVGPTWLSSKSLQRSSPLRSRSIAWYA